MNKQYFESEDEIDEFLSNIIPKGVVSISDSAYAIMKNSIKSKYIKQLPLEEAENEYRSYRERLDMQIDSTKRMKIPWQVDAYIIELEKALEEKEIEKKFKKAVKWVKS